MKLTRPEQLLIAGSILAGILLAGLAITGLTYGHERKQQQDTLHELNGRAFQRVQMVLQEFDGGFRTLADAPRSGCSDATVNRLRAVVKGATFLKSASVELGQNIYCTDSGWVYRDKPEPDYRTADGTMVWLYRNNLYGKARNTVYMQRGNIVLSTLHDHLLNVVSEPGTGIVLFSSKQKQIMSRHPARAQVDAGVLAELAGRNAGLVRGGRIYRAAFDPVLNVTVISFRGISTYAQILRHDLGRWLPLSLLFGLLAGVATLRKIELRKTVEYRLNHAIRHKDLQVHYQPIVALADGRCIGAECLIRWQDAEGRMVSPERFIPVAEETGLIEPLTDLILEKAIHELSDLLRDDTLYLSINLSAGDMGKLRFYPVLRAQLEQAGLAAGRIAIEATERGFVDASRANEVIAQMRDAGHAIFIDDFGTGYSSLSYLQKLAIDVIKIDKAFVDAIDTGSATSSVIVHIIAMAKQLKLKTVAEGVETGAQAEFLRSHGVDAGQGWLFSKPLPAREFRHYLERNHGRR